MIILNNLVHLPKHEDFRGTIQMIEEDFDFKSVSRITTNQCHIRANHRHPDLHLILINEGQIEYFEREPGSNLKPERHYLNKGDLFLTRANFEHCMYFPCFTVFDCYSTASRKQSNYDKNLVKLDFCLKKLYDNWVD